MLLSLQLLLKNLKNETVKRVPVPSSTDMIFSAGLATILLRSEDKIILFDVQQKRNVGEISASNIKYVIWNEKADHVALMGKDSTFPLNRLF